MKYLIGMTLMLFPALAYAVPLAGGDNQANRAQAQENLTSLMDKEFFINIVLGLLALVGTVIVAKFAKAKLVSVFEETLGTDESSDVAGVVIRTVNIIIWVIGFSLMLTFWGLDLSLLLGGVGIGLGFTMQIFLSNFIAGVIIIFGGEYKTGHIIQIEDREGTVKKVATLFTVVEQYDGVIFYVPNVKFLQEVVKCYTANTKRRIEVNVGLDYGEDVVKAKGIINKVIATFPNILLAPAPTVIVDDLGDNGIGLRVFFWIGTDDNYFTIKSNVTETVNLAFKQAGIKRRTNMLELKK